jgi:hypothetical protein
VLQAALSRDQEKVVELLVCKGADVNAQGWEYSNALHAAVSFYPIASSADRISIAFKPEPLTLLAGKLNN